MRPKRLALALLTLPIFIAGCGGGGGGSKPSTGVAQITTDWSTDTTPGSPKSERISILKPDGSLIATQTVNEGTGKTFTPLTVPSDAYQVKVELNNAPDFGGSVTGVLTLGSLGGNSTFSIEVGPPAVDLRIVPDTASLSIGQRLYLGVAGINANNHYTFLAPNTITFTGTGAAGSVTPAGIVTGLASGNFSVQATSSDLNKSVTSAISVANGGGRHGKWTVLVYLNAANDLYPYATPNVDQMERVAYNPDVRFVVQWKESKRISGAGVDFDGTRRYLVSSNTNSGLGSQLVQDLGTNVDMGSAQTLRDFIAWGQQTYPADHYALIVWNHGNGWQRKIQNLPKTRAVSYDDDKGTYIDIWDLPSALQGTHVDIFSFDACLMQMLEVASDIKGTCDYIATSEENTPGPGYPYDRIFKGFADNPNDTPSNLARNFVTGHVSYPPYQSLPVTQSVVDSTKVAAVESAVDGLANTLIAHRAQLTTAVPALRSSLVKYADANDGRYYYDLIDLAQHIQSSSSFPADVQAAAGTVVTATQAAVIWEGHTGSRSNSHGLAIDFSPSTAGGLDYYPNLNLAKVTHWDDWLDVAP